MRQHAFLMEVHKNAELFSRIVHVLASSNHHFFVHIDKKTKNFDDFQHAVADVPNVIFIERMSVFHGGVSQIYCELALYRAAYMHTTKMDYFHLISGQDYPLRTNEQFDAFFEKHDGTSFTAFEGQEYHDQCMKRKYPLRTDVYHPNTNNVIGRILRRLAINWQLKLKVRPCLSTTWGGWNWRSIHRSVVGYMLNYIEKHPEYLKRFNHTHCCDEIYFSTLFHPIEEAMKIDGSKPLRYVSWHPTHPVEDKYRPYTLDERDFEYVINSQAYFCRKVDLPKSARLLDKIDEQRGNNFDFDKATPVL